MAVEPLIISNWTEGISPSIVAGDFADMRCVDIYSEPGVLKPGWIGNKETASTVTDFVKWMAVRDGASSDIYAFGDTNKLYSYVGGSWSHVSGNTTSSGSGNGMVVWKGYALTFRDTGIDAYNIGGAAWTNNGSGTWPTFSGSSAMVSDTYHPAIVGQDDIVYFGNGRYVGTLKELTTFDPTSAATYQLNAYALDLPAGYRVRSLSELGTNLMVGTWQGSAIYDKKIADIFPWDRLSDSFSIPIRLNENGILQMTNVNNNLYVVAGIGHSAYVTNGVTTRPLTQIPQTLWNLDGGLFTESYPAAIAQHEGRILTGSAVGTVGGASPMGIFSFDPDGRLLFESQVSAGSANTVSIGAILPTGSGNVYYASWKNTSGSTYGIDLFKNNGRHSTASNTSVKSKLYSVGSKINPAKFSSLEIQLADALASGQSVVVGYRTDASSSFTTLVTFSHSTYGAVKSLNIDAGSIGDVENIQIEIQVASNSGATSSPKVLYVKLY